MNKRWMAAVMALLLLILAACGAPDEKQEERPVLPQEQEKPEETDSQEAKPPVENQTEEPTEEPPQEPAPGILDGKISVDGVVWEIPNAYVRQGLMQKIAFLEEDLLLFGFQYLEDGSTAMKLARLSLQTGEVVCETILNDVSAEDVQVCGSYVAVSNRNDGSILILDSALQESAHIETGYTGGMLAVDPALTKAFAVTRDAGVLVFDLQTGEQSSLLQEAGHLYGTSVEGQTLPLSYTDKNTQLQANAVLDLEHGIIRKLPFEGVYTGTNYTEGLWLTGIFGENHHYALGTETRPYRFVAKGQYSVASFL